MNYRLHVVAWIVTAALVAPWLAHAQGRAPMGERRVALVIGNSAYKEAPLRNPVNDARAIAARLRTLGFDVTLRENLKSRELGGIYREFRSKITPGAVALVFYAGHGLQVKGQNYFPAVDSDISGEEDVPLQSLNLGTLLDTMEEAKAGVNLVFLDACRDNPFARRFRSAARGLAKVEAASGTLIHYATRPGSVAADGNGRNGTYTEELLAKIGQPGIPVELMLKQVTNSVMAKTRGRQEPWVEGSLRGDFYFIFQGPTSLQVQPPAPDPSANDRALWETVKDSNNPDELRAYLDRFPEGLFSAVARSRLNALAGVKPPAQVSTILPSVPSNQAVAVAPPPSSSRPTSSDAEQASRALERLLTKFLSVTSTQYGDVKKDTFRLHEKSIQYEGRQCVKTGIVAGAWRRGDECASEVATNFRINLAHLVRRLQDVQIKEHTNFFWGSEFSVIMTIPVIIPIYQPAGDGKWRKEGESLTSPEFYFRFKEESDARGFTDALKTLSAYYAP